MADAAVNCANGRTVNIVGAGDGCMASLAVDFEFPCLQTTTFFYDRSTRELIGASFTIDAVAPCGIFSTTAGASERPDCSGCRLCGMPGCPAYPPCYADAGAD